MKKIKFPSELPPERTPGSLSPEFRAKLLIMRAAELRDWWICVFCQTLERVPEPVWDPDIPCPQCGWCRVAILSGWMDNYLCL